MPGKNFHLTPLESRRQLLLVESELNRAQLLNELREFKGQVRAIGAWAASAARLAGAFSAIGSALTRPDPDEKRKPSWIATLFKGAHTAAALWSAFQSNKK